MQATHVQYDDDTGILRLSLTTGESYCVDNAGVARKLKEKISPGGRISPEQRHWLSRFKVNLEQTNKARLKARLCALRNELRNKA